MKRILGNWLLRVPMAANRVPALASPERVTEIPCEQLGAFWARSPPNPALTIMAIRRPCTQRARDTPGIENHHPHIHGQESESDHVARIGSNGLQSLPPISGCREAVPLRFKDGSHNVAKLTIIRL